MSSASIKELKKTLANYKVQKIEGKTSKITEEESREESIKEHSTEKHLDDNEDKKSELSIKEYETKEEDEDY